MRVSASADCRDRHPARFCVLRRSRLVGRALPDLAERQTRIFRWLTFLCLGLVLLSGTIQAEHVHASAPGSPDTHAACSLCVTAHVGVEAAAAPLAHMAWAIVGEAEPPPARPAFSAPKNFDLYTRPPPADPTLA